MKKCRIGFIGIGNMNRAIVNSIYQNKNINLENVGLYTLNQATLNEYQKLGFTIFDSAQALANECEIIVLGVKPQTYFEVLETIKDYEFTLVFIAAGITIKALQRYSKKVIRVMPNLLLTINHGAVAISYEDVVQNDVDLITAIFNGCGIVERIDEKDMNTIITVSGSTPAYVYMFIEKMIQDNVNRGIPYDIAKKLITQTFIGAAKMLQNSDLDIQNHIDAVCSKGGTTIEAIKVLQDSDFEDIIKKANDNCIARAIEIGELYQ